MTGWNYCGSSFLNLVLAGLDDVGELGGEHSLCGSGDRENPGDSIRL